MSLESIGNGSFCKNKTIHELKTGSNKENRKREDYIKKNFLSLRVKRERGEIGRLRRRHGNGVVHVAAVGWLHGGPGSALERVEPRPASPLPPLVFQSLPGCGGYR